ncbi:hypothetical protein DFQ28_010182 [Apophysomyces sp. BC1034]|nr:hypothetical protein DFQ30_010055 [Apophysomyces sp. BC1015]KAG0181544.1 hypothetical protein DFQ29_008008 [Apophysomyces sp. BC1021]KAG0192093.1 hypothetical protein DFQ28_010182 [Apophysomyces sp. BC1034]
MGFMLTSRKFVEGWTAEKDIIFVIDYDLRRLQILFNHLNDRYRLEFAFRDIDGDFNLERLGRTTFFTIPLKYPARFWKLSKNTCQSDNKLYAGDQWERVTEIRHNRSAPLNRPAVREPLTPLVPEDMIQLGTWIVYRVEFSPPPQYQDQLESMLQEASQYNLVHFGHDGPRFSVISRASLPEPISHADRARNLSFPVLYMLETIIMNHVVNEYNMDSDFYDMVSRLDTTVAYGILSLIEAERKRVWNPAAAFHEIWNKMGLNVRHQPRIPSHCAMTQKVMVTPTGIYLQPPVVETTNRVVRNFKDYADRFLRVQFVDEGFERIGAFYTGTSNDAIYTRIFKTLHNGIQIGPRRYDFLAFSGSQLREHACWFFAPTKELSTGMIRNWMGTFSHVKVIAKHAVRMGQCFSSTRPVTELDEREIDYIDDIIRNGYTFSDGVGKISPKLSREIAKKLELDTAPSAYQIRLGGVKGVLSVSNFLNGRKIQLRPSQIKFESNHTVLEVVRTSALIPAYLNRQAITLLSSLGVKDEIFMNMLDGTIHSVNKMLGNQATAVEVLLTNVDEFGRARSMAQLVNAGFLEKYDPYLINYLHMFRVSVLKDLKKKAKIPVRKGALLIGILDETNTLQENEVFCQISDISTQRSINRKIITGDCIVFRNPCFHPGDIRVVTAVDNPKLRHLYDVVVFSAQGYRDIPSMCSGGDLDGDDYSIIWDHRLMPTTRNASPMDYTPQPPNEVDDVNISHIKKFFVNYINNDNLGQIANAHLAMSDLSAKGALDGNCRRLAQLHSVAVDFPKSGKPAILPGELRINIFPDFMQKEDKQSYRSQKVLGRIFREIDKTDYTEYQSRLVNTTEYDVRLRLPGIEKYIAEARESKYKYDCDLSALMNQYGVQTEAEITSGCIIEWTKKTNRKSTHEIQKQAMSAVAAMRKLWRKQFESEFYGDGSEASHVLSQSTRPQQEIKAAAWYYVTYHPVERCRNLSYEGSFVSFPWVVDDIICAIAVRNNSVIQTPELMQPVDNDLVEQFRKANMSADFQFSIADSDSESENEEYGEYTDEDEDDQDKIPVLEIRIDDLQLE